MGIECGHCAKKRQGLQVHALYFSIALSFFFCLSLCLRSAPTAAACETFLFFNSILNIVHMQPKPSRHGQVSPLLHRVSLASGGKSRTLRFMLLKLFALTVC